MTPADLLDLQIVGLSLPGVGLIVLALTLLPAILRGARGPAEADRAVAADHVFFVLVASIALFGLGWDRMLLMDLVLVATVIGFLSALVLGRYLGRGEHDQPDHQTTAAEDSAAEGSDP